MKQNYKKLILLFFAIIFILTANFVYALEVDYNIPGLPILTDDSKLPDYVRFIFALLTYLAGIIAVISFAIGAVQFSISAASPSAAKEGKDRMIGSILGLILTISAVIILRTINPAFTTPTITALPTTDGLYYTNESKYASAPTSDPDIANNGLDGFNKLIYKCSSGTPILVWTYENKNLDYSGGVQTTRLECGGDINIANSGSFKWTFESPGVYYCLGECFMGGCDGYMSEVNTFSQDEIPSPFKGNIQSVRIVNDPENSLYYGVVFHKEIGLKNGGECTELIIYSDKEICENLPTEEDADGKKTTPTFAVDIIKWNKDNSVSSGSGISIYNEVYGWNKDVKSGQINITKEEILTEEGNYMGLANKMSYDYSEINTTEATLCNLGYPSCNFVYENSEFFTEEEIQEYLVAGNCCLCTTVEDCLGSIQIKGDYFVGLYSYPKENKIYCQTFTKNVENIKAYKYVLPGEKLTFINIIATK